MMDENGGEVFYKLTAAQTNIYLHVETTTEHL